MKIKTPVYRNLKSIPVYFEDTSLTSEEVFRITEFPVRLTAGKNIFKLQGNPNNLNNGSYLDIEILDYNGDPIYHEVTDVITEDNSRIISVFIYGNTPPGDAEVILVATANSLFGELVPEEWLDYPNVRWSRLIPVNPTQNNVTEIIFNQLPNITIKEQVGAQLDRSYTTTQYPTYNTGTVRYVSNNSYPILIVSNGTFNNQMVGGTVTISNPVNPTPESYYDIPTIPYTAKIKKVLSNSSILLDTEYKIASSDSIIPHIYTNFDSSAYSISYEATPTYVPTQNSESYALVEIDNLDPIAGDVTRIKVFMNNTGTIGTWELINDIELEETDVFVTGTASLEPYKSIGDITSQTIINTYYTASSYLGKTQQTAPTLVYDNTDISNALKITSNVDLSDNNRVHILQVSSSVAGKFIKDSLYKITLDAVGTRTIASGNTDPEILIYASGSAFNYDYGDYYNQELPIQLGRQIGNLFVNDDSQRFDDSAFYFSADETGNGVLLFVIKGGEWKLSDIRTTTDNDKGFTPEYARIRSLVPTPHKSNVQFAFKIEYYNSDGAKSKQVNYTDGISWEGGNRYVDGEYSMITGSLYVADSLKNGIAISGYKDTGYIRSLGYDGFNAGFPGFLLWSGSAMKASSTTYDGVGLELYADRDNYFRYRTNPSELVVKTKSFYFGSSSQYISGSNGKLVISSSKFYLDPNGNVTLSGTVNITGGSGFATPGDLIAVSSSLSSSIANNSASAATSIGSVSSSLTTVSSSLTTVSSSLTTVSSSLNTSLSDATNRIVTDANAKITKTNDTPSTGKGLYLSQNYLGYYTGTPSNSWNSYISSSGDFLFKKDVNNLISFGNNAFILKVSDTVFMSGSNISLLTPNFFFGGATGYISGSGGKIMISGSDVTMRTPNFFLGNGSNYISGSGGNIMISGSNVTMRTPNFFFGSGSTFISGSNGKISISASNFSVDVNGNVTASNMHLDNVAYADGFVYTTIIINNLNYTQYYKNYTISGLFITGSAPSVTKSFTKLVLDGSLGGRSGRQVRIEYLPDYPIGMIIPPGYYPDSPLGYDLIIENWALSVSSNFSALPFASLVASSSAGTKGHDDFAIFADMWDRSATSYLSTGLDGSHIRQTAETVSYYGEGQLGKRQTYTSTNALSSNIMFLYYGNSISFQRTVNGTAEFQLKTGYFSQLNVDSELNTYNYYPNGFKTGMGVLMGGPGAHMPASRASDMHYDSVVDPRAVLELRGNTNRLDGSGSMFLPPRLSNTNISTMTNPPEGAMYFNTTTKKLMVYDGTTWQSCW